LTTIAYKDGMMAGDTGVCSDRVITASIRKVSRNGNGDLCAAAGGLSWAMSFHDWFNAGEKGDHPPPEENDSWTDTGLIVRADGSMWLYESDGRYRINAEYYALGSGREFAFGAMAVGATAEQAVQAAMRHDTHTNGDVDVVRLVEPRRRTRR
jgi:ATP-dependent HslUV protease subunit HslV